MYIVRYSSKSQHVLKEITYLKIKIKYQFEKISIFLMSIKKMRILNDFKTLVRINKPIIIFFFKSPTVISI